jgi:ABC-type polysaccharide/polyol phosphate export permease
MTGTLATVLLATATMATIASAAVRYCSSDNQLILSNILFTLFYHLGIFFATEAKASTTSSLFGQDQCPNP